MDRQDLISNDFAVGRVICDLILGSISADFSFFTAYYRWQLIETAFLPTPTGYFERVEYRASI
ncbi:MAG: hypothetical protein KUG52_02305 [Immundisolibacteraceae bacterium]|nr:hypothetical protein [Immundisolibacteraceae bacterium]